MYFKVKPNEHPTTSIKKIYINNVDISTIQLTAIIQHSLKAHTSCKHSAKHYHPLGGHRVLSHSMTSSCSAEHLKVLGN